MMKPNPKEFQIYHVGPEMFDQIGSTLRQHEIQKGLTEQQKLAIADRVGPSVREACHPIGALIGDLMREKDYAGIMFLYECLQVVLNHALGMVEKKIKKDRADLN